MKLFKYRETNLEYLIGSILDELSGFEDAWKGTAKKHFPGLADKFGGYENIGEFILFTNLKSCIQQWSNIIFAF